MKSKNNILAYRADIDGLRAFAIVSVIVFHSFPDILPGGFIGVDVFFVISGFLISKIIYEGMSSNSFSFAEFYIHRIRRIFPALVVVLFVVLAFGWFALVAEEYALLGKHSAGGVAFVNNVLLWKEDGYFGKASELKPLMHLWSLGVEEQFYLVFPIFIWLIWLIRVLRFRICLVVGLLAFLSFLANIHWVKIDSSGAFFLPHARLWELLIGSLLAYNSVFKDHKCDGFWIGKNLKYINCKELLSVIGFGFLIIGVFVIDKGKSFPGYWALLPVFGAALVIMSGPEAYFNRRLLSNNWMVFIGLISYPLYIWHWPILSYLRILEAKVPSVLIRLVAIFFIVLLAWITYEFVEKPLRNGAKRKLLVTKILVFLGAVLCVAGMYIFIGNGLPFREIEKQYGSVQNKVGHIDYKNEINDFVDCPKVDISGQVTCSELPTEHKPVSVAIVGDSHAADLFIGLASNAKKEITIAQFVVVCYPFIGIVNNDSCLTLEGVFNHILLNNEIKTVVLANYWVLRTSDKTIRLAEEPSNRDRLDIFAKLLETTLKKLILSGKQVVFAFDVPDLDFPPEACLPSRPMAITERLPGADCRILRKNVEERSGMYISAARKVLDKYPEVIRWDPYKVMCNELECLVAKDGVLLYRDTNHLSLDGGRWLAERYWNSYVTPKNISIKGN